MRRREFVAGFCAITAWPLTAAAQQTGAVRRVVFLHGLAENDPEVQARIAAFREGLEALGWMDNRNIQIAHRFASGDLARIQEHVADLVNSPPDVVAATGTPVIAALQKTIRNIPIVFSVVNDPAGQGFVINLARPGGNITGFSYVDFPMIGKWLEIMNEVVPGVRRMTLMFNPETAPYYPVFLREFGASGSSLARQVSASPVRNEAEIEAATTALAREPGGGLIAAPDPFINTHRALIISLARQHRLPTLFAFRQHVRDGGLMSYGPDSVEIVRHSASYVDRILRGEKPADLPVQGPTKYELAINLKTANALGLTIPPTLLARADEVIE
jgi:putative tryptophan/tyrosine transport system substrate-binding protein